MLDLKMHFNATYEDVARAVSAQGVGLLVGAVVAGLIVDILGKWKDVVITAAQLLTVISTSCMPYVGNISTLWFMFFINGSSAGAVNVAGQRILLEMWKEKAPSPMHALHMGFGIGALCAPLIANQFLAVLEFADETSDLPGANMTANLTPTDFDGTTKNGIPFKIIEETRVQYAFVTIGMGVAILSLPFFIYPLYICFSKQSDEELEVAVGDKPTCSKYTKLLNPATYANGSLRFGTLMFVVIFFFFMNLVGSEQLYGNFVRTFSVDRLNFNRDEASYLDTAYWGSFTLGRLMGSVLSHCVPIRVLLMIDVVLSLLAITFTDIFATGSHSLLWTSTVLVGFMIGPLFPACVSFINMHIEVGGIVLTLIIIASGTGHFFYIWIDGVLYDTYGPIMVLYAMQASAILVLIISLILMIITYHRKDRFQKGLADALFTSGSLQEMSYSRLKDEEE